MTGDSISIVVMVLAIILVIPLLCRKMHIPSIVGFIAMGIVIGPSVLNLIPAGSTTLTTLGQLGMLYIMFQAGIEIDRNDFLQQRRRAVYFGLLTFLVPFCLGLMTGWAMGFDRLTMILLAAIYGSHTLMTYPIVTRYGIQKSPAVTIAVGGTSIAMVLSLGVLVVVKNNYLDVAAPWWFFTIRIVGFLIAVAWLMPKMLHWVFKRWQDPLLEFMIVMLALVVSSWLADLVDLEPILGAFLCGAALNGLVPKRSQLMDEINFLGNGIFVPMFLLSVGMMMDLSSFKSGGLVFAIAGLMIGTKLVGKWLASWIAQRGFRMSGDERRLLFGLTHASAAGTLAIATIGHQIGLFDSYILNAAVILILVLSILASFGTDGGRERPRTVVTAVGRRECGYGAKAVGSLGRLERRGDTAFDGLAGCDEDPGARQPRSIDLQGAPTAQHNTAHYRCRAALGRERARFHLLLRTDTPFERTDRSKSNVLRHQRDAAYYSGLLPTQR